MAKVYNKQEALHSLLNEVVKLIQEEEPDYDFVDEVIRCKNCKHYEQNTSERISIFDPNGYCYLHGYQNWLDAEQDDFCSWAERKEE